MFKNTVSTCTKLLVTEETAEKVVGGILLPFYVLVPLWKLRGGAASVKAAVKEVAGEQSYQDSLGIFSKKAVESKINEVTAKDQRKDQKLSRDSPGYKASVTAVLISPYEEEFWWWKIVLMLEKALLAMIVLVGAPSWFAVGVSGCGWLASTKCT